METEELSEVVYDAKVTLVEIGNYRTYQECWDDLFNQDCTFLGWLTPGKNKLLKNYSFIPAWSRGITTIYVDRLKRVYYSVNKEF